MRAKSIFTLALFFIAFNAHAAEPATVPANPAAAQQMTQNMTPEQQQAMRTRAQAMRQRMEQMTPEQRQAMRGRMQEQMQRMRGQNGMRPYGTAP